MASPNSLGPDTVPAIRKHFLRRDVDGQAIAWSAVGGYPVALDHASTVMLDVIDGNASIEQLGREVADEVGVPPAVASAQVSRIVDLLYTSGLLETVAEPAPGVPYGLGTRPLVEGPLSH